MKLVEKLLPWVGDHFVERFLSVRLLETRTTEAWMDTDGGRRLYLHIHEPVGAGRFPAVVIAPGGESPGTDYDRPPFVTARQMAGLGVCVIHYDPSGRGRSQGSEDFWGPGNQREFSDVIRFASSLPRVDPAGIGVVSFSIGIVIAAGALARFSPPRVRYLFDWEGPSDRMVTTKNNTHPPLLRFPTSNEEFWKDREAIRFMKSIRCPYFRYQGRTDHVQGCHVEHAADMINAALDGGCPWTRMNDNPVNTRFDKSRIGLYDLVPDKLNHKGQILNYVRKLVSTTGS